MKGTHNVSKLTAHIVWSTKYRYRILSGDIQICCRELLKQICDANSLVILKGVVSTDHIHMHLLYSPRQSISQIVQKLKGRSARKLLQDYPQLRKRYYGGNLCGIGYGVWSTGEYYR